jgi:hypothetical protein
MRSELFFQTPSWFILICLLIGAAYAYTLYKAQAPWDKKVNYLLAACRAVVVSLICFLLLAPLVRHTQTQIEKGKVVFAIDDSQSLEAYGKSMLVSVQAEARRLQQAGYDVLFQTMDHSDVHPDSITFKQTQTDLSKLLNQVSSTYEGLHVTDVILVSDGIVNQGILPTYASYPFRVSTLALGDTIPRVDVGIKDVIYNRIAYLGNEFPIKAEVFAHELAGKSTKIHLKQGGKIVSTQQVTIGEGTYFKSFEFTASSKTKGIQHYTLEIDAVSGETTKQNNRKDIYVDIIDGRQKILLLAYAPHPDIKALKSILDGNDNYELDVLISTVTENASAFVNKPYDLIIAHQVPNLAGKGTDILRKYIAAKIPVFYVLGSQTAIPLINQVNRTVQIQNSKGQIDQVGAQYNTSFQQLNLMGEEMKILDKLPPLSVPFGEYVPLAGTESLLYQRIGNLNTTKPLLSLNTSGEVKTGFLAGEGIWHWRQEEFARMGDNVATTQLFQKVIQLLSVRSDQRKFRVYPIRSEFELGDAVVFQTEIYNEAYELVYGKEIQLALQDEQGKTYQYNYVNTPDNPQFSISGLSEGVYEYQAVLGKESASGQFIVRRIDVEHANLTANHSLLRNLSEKSGGTFSTASSFEKMVDRLVENPAKGRLSSSEEMVDLIDLKWIFALLLLFLTAEWGMRKYHGGY